MKPDSGRLAVWLRPLMAYATVLTRDRDTAQDLVQDTALRALTAIRAPRAAEAYRRWLFCILRRRHLDDIRSRTRRQRWSADIARADRARASSLETDPAANVALEQALERLPESQREVVVLVDVWGYRYAEAAARLNVPEGTIMSRLARARRRLLEESGEAALVSPREDRTR